MGARISESEARRLGIRCAAPGPKAKPAAPGRRAAAPRKLSKGGRLPIAPALFPEISFAVLGVENSVASRTSYGGTAPDNVRRQAEAWLEKLGPVEK